MEALIHRPSNYSEDITVQLKSLNLVFQFYKDITEIYNCLPRSPSRFKCRKVSSQGHKRMARMGFKPRPRRSQSQCADYSTTLPTSRKKLNKR